MEVYAHGKLLLFKKHKFGVKPRSWPSIYLFFFRQCQPKIIHSLPLYQSHFLGIE